MVQPIRSLQNPGTTIVYMIIHCTYHRYPVTGFRDKLLVAYVENWLHYNGAWLHPLFYRPIFPSAVYIPSVCVIGHPGLLITRLSAIIDVAVNSGRSHCSLLYTMLRLMDVVFKNIHMMALSELSCVGLSNKSIYLQLWCHLASWGVQMPSYQYNYVLNFTFNNYSYNANVSDLYRSTFHS